jgi:hypothetical protein
VALGFTAEADAPHQFCTLRPALLPGLPDRRVPEADGTAPLAGGHEREKRR